MSLSELIGGVEAHEKTLTVFDADPAVVADVRERFADRNVAVETATSDAGLRPFAVLSEGGVYLTGLSAGQLSEVEGTTTPSFGSASYRSVLDHLDETMSTSYDPAKMLAASREIEDRAWRLGVGGLHAGFQTTELLATQAEAYERLAGRGSLEVHAYACPDAETPRERLPDGVSLHVEDADELRNCWFVAYDGAGVDENKCALVAEEREPRRFYGFWTYDPSTVDYVVDHLSGRYLYAATDGGGSGRGEPDGGPIDDDPDRDHGDGDRSPPHNRGV